MEEEWEMFGKARSGRWWTIHPAERGQRLMAHSFVSPSGRSYHYNGDFSGDIKLDYEFELPCYNSGELYMHKIIETVRIPAQDVKALAAQYVRNTQISKMEQASDEEILGWEW